MQMPIQMPGKGSNAEHLPLSPELRAVSNLRLTGLAACIYYSHVHMQQGYQPLSIVSFGDAVVGRREG